MQQQHPGAPQLQELTITNNGTGAALTINQMNIRPAEAANSYTVLWDDRATAEEDFVEWGSSSSDIIQRSNSKVFRDLHVLDVHTMSWVEPPSGGIPPGPLYGHTAQAVGRCVHRA